MAGSGIDSYDVVREVDCGAVTGTVFEDLRYHGGKIATRKVELTCPWSGRIDVRVDDFGVGRWTCPSCGTEHEVQP